MTRLDTFYSKLQRAKGVEIVYRRGEHSTEPITVVPTKTRLTAETPHGFRVEKAERQYIVHVDQIVLDGQKTLPSVNDRIIEGDREYAVLKATDRDAWAPMESSETLIRIFVMRTK